MQLDLDQILDAAIVIADREGPQAMTMRKIAHELGVGAMSLYWYIPTKRELEAQVLGRIFRDASPPDATGPDWRENLAAIARSARAHFLKHPWVLDFLTSVTFLDEQTFGHGFLQHFENSMRMVDSLPFSFAEKSAILEAIDGFTQGFVFREVLEQRRREQLPETDAEMHERMAGRMEQLLAERDYPLMRQFMAHDQEMPEQDAQFEAALAIILDGVELRLQRMQAQGNPPPPPPPTLPH